MKARIKGTDIIVECLGVGTSPSNDGKGIECRYLTGRHKGASETIPGDCLVELDGEPNWKELRYSTIANFTITAIAKAGMPADESVRRNIVDAATEMADYIEKRLKED